MSRSSNGARSIASLSVAWLASLGCSLFDAPAAETQDPTFPVSIAIHGDARQPVAGAEILDQKRVLGKTDASGRVTLKLKGREGTTVSLDIKCPATFKSPEKPILIGLRHMSENSPMPKFEAECIPLVRTVVVGLRAENGPNLNIVHLNQVVGRTDAHGTAHVMLQAEPGQPVSLTLSTAGNPYLKPQNPTLTFVVADRNEMVLLEQKFTLHKPVIRAKPRTIPQPL